MLVSTQSNFYYNNRASGGLVVDPQEYEILADTGALRQGRYACMVSILTEVLDNSMAQFAVHRRDAADENDVEVMTVTVPVDDSKQFEFGFNIKTDERITVTPLVPIVGNIVASINWQRLL